MRRRRNSPALLLEDFKIRNFIKKHPKKNYSQAGIDRIEIERTRDEVKIVLYVARPGLIIGKKGQEVEILQEELQNLTGRRVNLKIEEIGRPEIMAQLVAEDIAQRPGQAVELPPHDEAGHRDDDGRRGEGDQDSTGGPPGRLGNGAVREGHGRLAAAQHAAGEDRLRLRRGVRRPRATWACRCG